jgi:hypothetical protein
MTSNNKKDINRPKRVQKLAEELAELCGKEQTYHATKAQEFGYARDVFTDIKNVFVHIPYDEPLLSSAENSLINFRRFIEAKKSTQQFNTDVSSTAYFLGTSTVVSGSVIDPNSKIFEVYNIPKPPSFWPRDRIEQYALRLDKLDTELGKVYRSTWSSLLGNKENPERAAMYQMRQAYDHFFYIIAPDDEVRKSQYFQEKVDKPHDRVSRKERLHYAANLKIKDQDLHDLLLGQNDYMIELYQRLNKAHERSSIDSKEAKETLNAMRVMLEQWIDAINI